MLFREFKDLGRRKDRRIGMPDLLNYAFLGAPGVVVLKDGAMMTCFAYRGPDLNSAAPLEISALKHHTNRILSHHGDGFMISADLIRHPSIDYPTGGPFPDPTTALIDREREMHYTAEGKHLETSFALSFIYRPPPDYQSRPAKLFVSSHDRRKADGHRTLDYFCEAAAELEQALSSHLRIRRMDDGEMLSFLESCIIGRPTYVRPPATFNHLDAGLGNYRFVPGFTPTIEGRHIRIVAPAGFPLESHAEVTAFLSELPFCYRWSIRAIMLDPTTGVQQLSTMRRNWFQKRLDFKAFLKESFAGSSSSPAFQNQHALDMAADADMAVAEAHGALVRYCYLTMNVVVIEDDAEVADAHAQEVRKHFMHHGFPARIEDLNACDAYLGSLPGHGHHNVRKPVVHTQNLADLISTTAVWAGLETNPCPMYPDETPALIHASTSGRTPFRYHPHVGDVGHNLVIGPVGAGKSTFLEVFLRPCSLAFVVYAYERARRDLVLPNIEVVSPAGFRENEGRVSLVEMKDLHVGDTESLCFDDSEERALARANRADNEVVTYVADVWMIPKGRAPACGSVNKCRRLVGIHRAWIGFETGPYGGCRYQVC